MVNCVIRLKRGDPRILLELHLVDSVAILKPNFVKPTLFHLVMIHYAPASMHGYFPVKSPNYFTAEAPSNPLLNLPFNLTNVRDVQLLAQPKQNM